MPDPVAEKSSFLCMYMSNHPDTLVAWAKYYGKVTEHITGAKMTAIDSKSISLSCTTKSGPPKAIRIPIEPPLKSYDEVKPRLIEMQAIAKEKLGMISAPRITSFHMPPDAWISGVLVASLIYLTFSPSNSTTPVFYPANLANGHLNSTYVNFSTYVLLGIHALESIYTFTLCRKHKTGFFVGATHIFATIFCGFPIWREMRRRAQDARIESVMKGH